MNLEAADASDDATNNATPEEAVGKLIILLIDLIEEPAQPQDDSGSGGRFF